MPIPLPDQKSCRPSNFIKPNNVISSLIAWFFFIYFTIGISPIKNLFFEIENNKVRHEFEKKFSWRNTVLHYLLINYVELVQLNIN